MGRPGKYRLGEAKELGLSMSESRMRSGQVRTWPWLPRRGEKTEPPSVKGLLSQGEFEEHLLRERARADRTGLPFVVLSFGLAEGWGHRKPPQQMRTLLAMAINECFRLSDTKGWSGKNEGQVTVLLPDTSREAAMKPVGRAEELFQAQLQRAFSPDVGAPDITCDVYAYPSDSWVDQASGRDADRKPAGVAEHTV